MEINEYLVKLFETIKDLENIDFFLGTKRLSRTEFRLLREVILENNRGREIISSELARRLGITRSAVSQIITKLEERNVVRRMASATDKKIAYVRLSEASISVFNEQCSRANKLVERVVERFGEDRINELIDGYQQLAAVFLEVRNEFLDAESDDEIQRTEKRE